MNAAPARLADWPERLAEYLARHRGAVFGWGGCDCVRFAAGAAEAITGRRIDLPHWSDKRTAAQALRRRGGLIAAVDGALPRLPSPTLVQRGDVVLVQPPATPAAGRWLAVCDGPRAWAPSRAGLVAVPVAHATHAWGIGRG